MNTQQLTPWRSNYTETLASTPICVKYPSQIDSQLRNKPDRSIWFRKVVELWLRIEKSYQRAPDDCLDQVEQEILKKVQDSLDLDAEVTTQVLQIFYQELATKVNEQ